MAQLQAIALGSQGLAQRRRVEKAASVQQAVREAGGLEAALAAAGIPIPGKAKA